MSENAWFAGQKVVCRSSILTVERVTPSGLAVIGAEKYGRDGYRRGGTRYLRDRIVPLTDELRAAMEEKAALQNMMVKWEKLERRITAALPSGWRNEAFITAATLTAICDAVDALLAQEPQP